MGAVANLRPDLFRAIVAEVPFVDCLTTMLDESLPLTITEWEEWGDPAHDPAIYDYIKSYAPYDNVAALDYPALLVTAGLNDPRVQYWEPAKWVAKLRETATGDAPLCTSRPSWVPATTDRAAATSRGRTRRSSSRSSSTRWASPK